LVAERRSRFFSKLHQSTLFRSLMPLLYNRIFWICVFLFLFRFQACVCSFCVHFFYFFHLYIVLLLSVWRNKDIYLVYGKKMHNNDAICVTCLVWQINCLHIRVLKISYRKWQQRRELKEVDVKAKKVKNFPTESCKFKTEEITTL